MSKGDTASHMTPTKYATLLTGGDKTSQVTSRLHPTTSQISSTRYATTPQTSSTKYDTTSAGENKIHQMPPTKYDTNSAGENKIPHMPPTKYATTSAVDVKQSQRPTKYATTSAVEVTQSQTPSTRYDTTSQASSTQYDTASTEEFISTTLKFPTSSILGFTSSARISSKSVSTGDPGSMPLTTVLDKGTEFTVMISSNGDVKNIASLILTFCFYIIVCFEKVLFDSMI